MVRGEQLLNQRDHFRNVARGARHDVGTFAAERVGVFPKRIDVLRCVVVNTQSSLLRLGDDAVFHVSDVHHMPDIEALELQVTAHNISSDGTAKVSDVTVTPDGWTTVIEADFAFLHGTKLF